MKKIKLLPILLISITTLIVGLMNTVFIKPEDIGSWKNYIGVLFLLIAIVNTVLFAFVIKKSETKNKPFDVLLKIFAFVLPFYFIFYDSLYASQEKPRMKELMRFLVGGFLVYFILGLIFYFKLLQDYVKEQISYCRWSTLVVSWIYQILANYLYFDSQIIIFLVGVLLGLALILNLTFLIKNRK